MNLKEQFEASIEKGKGLPSQGNETLLELYGLYKQATVGDVQGEAPSGFDFRGAAKYAAWEKRRGMTPTRPCRPISISSIDLLRVERVGMTDQVVVDGRTLDIEGVEAVARHGAGVTLDPEARSRVAQTRRVVEDILASGAVVYGVNTGFGKLAEVRVAPEQLSRLQLNLLRSHACGVGEPFAEAVVRAMLLLRANVLATGHAGCRPVVVDRVLDLLNAGVHPVVPSRGSVGASGDLAPLAHLALALVGEGEAIVGGERMAADEALRRAGVSPLELAAKEGLALINGTQASVAVAALAVAGAGRLIDAADVICSLTLDALAGTDAAFDPAVHAARPHPGQLASAGTGSRCSTAPRSASHIASVVACRMPTRCGARRRSMVRPATPSLRSAGFCRSSSTPPPTTRWSSWMAASCRPGTSTERRSPSCSTTWRRPSPTSRRSRNGDWRGSSTVRCRGCPRSCHPSRASTRDS